MSKAPLAALSAVALSTTGYPAPFVGTVQGRSKRRLGDLFGLQHFGVNLTELLPGAGSALKHHHSVQDEFVYLLAGEAVLVLGEQEFVMRAGDCVGFAAGQGLGHQLLNRSEAPVLYLEVGDRNAGDEVTYPDVDLKAVLGPDGRWAFLHKNGEPY